MGALHTGHISLVEQSKLKSQFTVATIFVNPTQFNNKEDLQKYPRPITTDIEKLKHAGCDALFMPSINEIYTDNENWEYQIGNLENILEGKYRPGHYSGVTQIVWKLFDITKPDIAFFGQKDYQQFLVISKMVADFCLPVSLICAPIIREKDGLAMSSRNIHLNAEERETALLLFNALKYIKANYLTKNAAQLLKNAKAAFVNKKGVDLDYLEICDEITLQKVHNDYHGKAIALIACHIGKTRLIDNMMLP